MFSPKINFLNLETQKNAVELRIPLFTQRNKGKTFCFRIFSIHHLHLAHRSLQQTPKMIHIKFVNFVTFLDFCFIFSQENKMETETQTYDSETKNEKVKCVEILKWLKNEISMMRNHQEELRKISKNSIL